MQNSSRRLLAVGLCFLSLMAFGMARDFIVPGDSNGDKLVSNSELQEANDSYKKGTITLDQLESIKTIHDKYPRKVNDTLGRMITIWKPLERIIIFDHGMAEDFRILKAQNKLIAIDKYTKELTVYFPEISKLPSVGTTGTPDIEAIMKLDPDAVIFYATDGNESCNNLQTTLSSADPNMVIIRMDGYKEPHFIKEIESLGIILDRENESTDFIDFYNYVLAPIKSQGKTLSEDDKVRVYMEGSSDYSTCAQGAGFETNFLMANCRNIFADALAQYPTISDEDIIVRDPEVVVKIWGYKLPNVGGYNSDDVSKVEAIRDAIINRPGWSNMTAVKNSRVYAFYNNLMYGAQHFIGIAYLAKMFYPESFPDMDPQAIHQDYLTRFQHLDYNLDKHGVFVYPPLNES